MKSRHIRRPPVRDGYDLWADSYDATPNPVVAMDARHAIPLFNPQPAECILDAGCGTGRNLASLCAAGAQPYGIDFSLGMLRVARRKLPSVPLLQADLERELPLRPQRFDAVLCTLIGEHLSRLAFTFRQFHHALKPGGRLLFTVYHPDLAAAGIEANFDHLGAEYRLGAVLHTAEDYLHMAEDAGFTAIVPRQFQGDEALATAIPKAAKLSGRNVLFTIEARRPA